MNRRSCSSAGRPRHAGICWSVRKRCRSPLAPRTSSTAGAPSSADQLVLQVRVACVEPELLQVSAEAGPLERSAEHRLLSGVAETREPHAVQRTELLEEAPDAVRAAEPDDPNAGRFEIDVATFGECLERSLVAEALDDDLSGRYRDRTSDLLLVRPDAKRRLEGRKPWRIAAERPSRRRDAFPQIPAICSRFGGVWAAGRRLCPFA